MSRNDFIGGRPGEKYEIDERDGVEMPYEGPRNETEKTLVAIWEELLETAGIGVHDDFFSLGGNSLKAMRLRAILKKVLGREIALSFIVQHPTIAALSRKFCSLIRPLIENERNPE